MLFTRQKLDNSYIPRSPLPNFIKKYTALYDDGTTEERRIQLSVKFDRWNPKKFETCGSGLRIAAVQQVNSSTNTRIDA